MRKHGAQAWQKVYSRPERAEEYALLMKLAGGKWHQDMLGASIQALHFLERRPESVIELGAGTGKLSRRLLRRFPGSRLIAVDGSDAMLEKARASLRSYGSRVSYFSRDFGDSAWRRDLPACDAVISTIAIHHLSDSGKKRLYRQVFDQLKSGGIFVNGDAVWPQDRGLKDRDDRMWAMYIQRRLSAVTGENKPVDAIVDWIDRTRRAEGDRPASLAAQMDWLRDAGFVHVDCFWKNFGFAVFGGVKL